MRDQTTLGGVLIVRRDCVCWSTSALECRGADFEGERGPAVLSDAMLRGDERGERLSPKGEDATAEFSLGESGPLHPLPPPPPPNGPSNNCNIVQYWTQFHVILQASNNE